ncbi:hypothetical protein [Streptomyces sp. NPDC047079]|uniref:hypothetical protein n=1 Tax=Streptomyces sp. NPDC047079 TaxID=3154607 RepID=UPI0033D030EF
MTRTPKAKKPAKVKKPAEAKKPPLPEAGQAAKSSKRNPTAASGEHTITLTLPGLGEAATWAVSVAAGPVATARRALTARHGLPLYAGLGALAAVGALEWPLAVGVGIGYAVLRSKGLLPRRSATSK